MESIEYAEKEQSEFKSNTSKIYEEVKSDISSQKLNQQVSPYHDRSEGPVNFINMRKRDHSRNSSSLSIFGSTNSNLNETNQGTFGMPHIYKNQIYNPTGRSNIVK